MKNRLYAFIEWIGDVFWAIPAMLSLAGVLLAELALRLDGPDRIDLPQGMLFAQDVPGARALLGVVAGSAIGVAGTIFSITIAALSLTSGQMGPRLLRNFLRDTGNKWALGLFLLTFAYCIELQRGMGAPDRAAVPHLGLILAVALALLCTGLLAWFVHHVASGINVETVIALVHEELLAACRRLTTAEPAPDGLNLQAPDGAPVRCPGTGYLRAIDYAALADWAAAQGAMLSVLARPGDYLHDAARVAEVLPEALAPDAMEAMRRAMTLGARPAATQDLEFAVRQLVEVAVRALSPGINDPFTAITVLERLGAALCGLSGRHLPPPALLRDGVSVLHRRVTTYEGLSDAMFHMIRQAGAGSAAVLLRLIDVAGEALDVERDPVRRAHLVGHVDLALAAGRGGIADRAGLAALEARAAQALARA